MSTRRLKSRRRPVFAIYIETLMAHVNASLSPRQAFLYYVSNTCVGRLLWCAEEVGVEVRR
jgi:hypothetical protein